jgi:nitroreductase
MNVNETIRARRSIRVFKAKPIEEDKLNRVLDAARLAPSARNLQDWKFIVVRDKDLREQLMKAARNQNSIAQAPVVIAGCGTICTHIMSCGQPSYTVDVSIAMEHIALQAAEEGLGTCWVCAFDEAEVKRILNVPADARVVALMPMGYPGEAPEARARKELKEIVSYDRFA